jgi:hypothetical protein
MPDLPKRHWPGGAAAIRRNTRSAYGRPLEEIEAEIGAFMASLAPQKRERKRKEPQPEVLGETPPEALHE